MSDSFQTFLKNLRQDDYPKIFKGLLVCFDPGETTGVAIFEDAKLIHTDQINTKDLQDGTLQVSDLFDEYQSLQGLQLTPAQVVIEDYRVYGWKTEQHAFAELHTPKFIGCLIAICTLRDIPFHLQMAQQAKGFCTDDKLRSWDLYQKNMRHARDAIRHGTYYQLFNKDMVFQT